MDDLEILEVVHVRLMHTLYVLLQLSVLDVLLVLIFVKANLEQHLHLILGVKQLLLDLFVQLLRELIHDLFDLAL